MFNATQAVSSLDWTFRPHVDANGVTPEFTDERIVNYWTGLQELYRDNRNAIEGWDAKRKELGDDPTTEDYAEVEAAYTAWQRENGATMRRRRAELLAELCGHSPNADQLSELSTKAARVFDVFETHMQNELTPKDVTSAGS